MRVGTARNVTRADPEVYSEARNTTAGIATSSCTHDMLPSTSWAATPADRPESARAAIADSIPITARPTTTAPGTGRFERSVTNLIHSLRSTRPKLTRPAPHVRNRGRHG